MIPERKPPQHAVLPFEVWELQLRKDCEFREKISAFNAMGDYVLMLLWELGVDPTVQAILDIEQVKPN